MGTKRGDDWIEEKNGEKNLLLDESINRNARRSAKSLGGMDVRASFNASRASNLNQSMGGMYT